MESSAAFSEAMSGAGKGRSFLSLIPWGHLPLNSWLFTAALYMEPLLQDAKPSQTERCT